MATAWTPPAGTRVTTTQRPVVCCMCNRPEPAGATVLAYKRKGSRPFRKFRCVDTGDCDGIVKLGRWPAARRPLYALAEALDCGYTIVHR